VLFNSGSGFVGFSIEINLQVQSIPETQISLDNGIKRYVITFVGIFKRTLRSPLKINFQMEATKVFVIYWYKKGHDATQIDQKLSTGLGHTSLADSTIID
jgi:hypothetical protein